ncbi:unnamed protein product [Cutaneotrichosporon oleaginosum]
MKLALQPRHSLRDRRRGWRESYDEALAPSWYGSYLNAQEPRDKEDCDVLVNWGADVTARPALTASSRQDGRSDERSPRLTESSLASRERGARRRRAKALFISFPRRFPRACTSKETADEETMVKLWRVTLGRAQRRRNTSPGHFGGLTAGHDERIGGSSVYRLGGALGRQDADAPQPAGRGTGSTDNTRSAATLQSM